MTFVKCGSCSSPSLVSCAAYYSLPSYSARHPFYNNAIMLVSGYLQFTFTTDRAKKSSIQGAGRRVKTRNRSRRSKNTRHVSMCSLITLAFGLFLDFNSLQKRDKLFF